MEDQTFTISLTPDARLGTASAFCSQYDVGRVLCAYIKDATTNFEIPSDAACVLVARKPDGNSYVAAVDNMETYVQIVTEEQLTASAGKVVCEIQITTSSYSISTANFILYVEECPSEGATDSESAINAIQTAVDAASEALASATAAAAYATAAAESASAAESAAADAAEDAAEAVYEQVEEAEKYAILAESWAIGGTGTRDDEDTNNSEYWSDYARDLILESLGFSIDDDGNVVQEEIG